MISIEVTGLDQELVSDRCWSAGAAGIWEASSETWRVGVEEEDLAVFVEALADLEPRDVTETEAFVLATRTVSVAGLDLEVPPTVFGDGAHPTTAGCLSAIAAAVRSGDTVADIGCGTGVLAIAAARAGATVTAIDVDAVAMDTTRANAEANGVLVETSTTPASELSGTFDVVVANITAGSVRPLLCDLVRVTAATGCLIVSGILDDQWPDIESELLHLFAEAKIDVVTDVRDGWVTATLHPA